MNVVFRNITKGQCEGVITWSAFDSEDCFCEWYDEKMKSWYEVVEKDVTEDRAIELCSTPSNTLTTMYSIAKKII